MKERIKTFFDKFKALFKFRKKEKIEKEKNKFVITKEVCIVLFIILELVLFNVVLFISKIIPYEEYNSIEFLALVFFNPMVLIVLGFIYSFNYGFSWFLPSVLMLAFLPSIISFLSPSFAFYLPIYFIFVVASELCGVGIIKIRKD